MDAVFPITQRNGEPYHTLSDFTKLFDQVKSGRYLLGQGYGWHSGVHLTSKMVPWGKGLRPIQAMMDGKIIAYRIHPDYQTTTYKDQELKYSNNFVLLEHEYKNPEKDDEVFKLYSLYMHLAPPSDIGANSSLTTRYKLVDDGWNVRTFKLGGAPERGKVESKVSMSSGTVLEYLHAEEQETVGFEIGGHTYKMIKCRVVQLGDSPSSSEKKMKGKIVWFAAGKDSDFDILNDTSVMIPEPVSEPEWMSKDAASLRDGSVVTLGLPLPLNIDFGAIEVKAGDELGYMGLHEYSNDAHATKKEDNRVHIELFSVEKPPEFFLKKIAPKNAEESPLIIIDGSGSDGALSVSNAFYSQLLEELSKGEEIDFSVFKPREAKVYLENKRKHFERVIAKHPSDWYTDVTKDSYSMIHQLAKEVMDEKYMTGFVSEKDYLESPWRSEVMNHHDMFSQHERERADKFSWMQDTQSKITLPDDKSVWHYWPFVTQAGESKIKCDPSHLFYTEILVHEGDYINDPDDVGGHTNKGVILDTWKRYSKKLFGVEASVETLKNITDQQAYAIFLEGYWKKSYADQINSCPVAFQFVDFYYNAPQGSAVVLQRAINALGGDVVEDWNMGPGTLKATNELISQGKEKELYITFREKRIEYYNYRADNVPNQDKFREGWLTRARSFNYF
ncbi:hypothetical protein L1D15_00265 [Vibrio sp. Isolate25]|uniref:glycoside hydrolase family 108 protein n=1 Tax=Vibrio sp. Isolate25 TaxID=2908535 RepID=UPI001EFE5708|nr:glycosyl hydrolase 108 family protein [Vibrio sp. Isolate25]MCG9595144.1 hypothetical protein [Vibrio sp. Isolate25]